MCIVLLAAFVVMNGSDDSEAAVTTGDITGASGDIGDWSYDDVSHYLTLTFTRSESPSGLSGFSSGSDVTRVTVVGNTGDIRSSLSALSIPGSATVLYQGSMPSAINIGAAGTWTYDLSSKTMTFSRSPSAQVNIYTLYNGYVPSSQTVWFGYFFKADVDKVVIDGYRSGGKHIFKDFSALKTVTSSTMTDFDREMFQNTSVEEISFTALANLVNSRLNGVLSLKTANFPAATNVDYDAFRGCTGLTTVVLGSAGLGNNAFNGCIRLSSITSESITAIGDHTFYGCAALGPQTFSNVATVGPFAFGGCSSMTSVSMPKVTMLSASAFRESSISGDLTFDMLITISDSAFIGCTGITSVNLPKIATISNNAFNGCTGLTSATLSEDLSSIGVGVFSGCSNLSNVSTLGKITIIPNELFRNSGITTVVIPFTVIQINYLAFHGSALENIEIPGSVKTIGTHVFQNCTQLKSLKFNEGIEGIGNYAFENCTALEGTRIGGGTYSPISMPDSLKSIDQSAFSKCRSLVGISFGPSSHLETIGNNAFSECNNLSGKLEFGNELITVGVSAFEAAPITGLKFGTSDATIGDAAFRRCSSLDSLDLGNGVVSIGVQAFHMCTALRGTVNSGGVASSISIPDKMTGIKNNAFNGCTALTGVVFSPSSQITSLEYRAFLECRSLSGTIVIPNGLEKIAFETFELCISLQAVDLGTGVTEIEYEAFNGCIAMTSVSGGASCETIGRSAFYGCVNIVSIAFDNAETIGTYAFFNCNALASVSLQNVVTIEANAFQNCGMLIGKSGGIISTDNLQTVGNYAFDGCRKLVGLTGNSMVTIGDYAFRNCNAFNCALNMPNLRTIGDYAFAETAVSSFSFGVNLERIGTDAILRNTNLSSITVPEGNGHYAVVDGVLYDKSINTLFIYPAKMAKNGLTIPGTVHTVYKYALYKSALTGELVLPESITSVGEKAFADSPGITSIVVRCTGSTVLTGSNPPSNSPFQNCSGVTKITVPISVQLASVFSSNTYIKEFRFTGSGASGFPTEYYQNNWRSMPWSWWAQSNWQISVNFESGITSVDPWMFYRDHTGYATITSVTLADSIREIGSRAFYNCNKITTLVLPNGLTSAGTEAFFNCTAVTSLTVPISFRMDVGGNSDITRINTLRFTPGTGEGADYSASTCQRLFWYNSSGYNLTFDEGIVSIGDYSYLKPSSTVSFPVSLDFIGTYAFSGSSVTNLNLNDGLKGIGDNAFGSCPNIANLVIPDTVETVGDGAFGNCTALRTLSVPVTLKCTAAMFQNCPVHTFRFTAGSDGAGADYDDESSKTTPWYSSSWSRDITVSFNGVKSIGDYMFAGCAYSDGVTSFGLTGGISFPDSLTDIGAHAFDGCAKISSVTLGGNVREVGHEAFSGCTALSSLVIGGNVSAVGEGVFKGCTSLTTLTIPISFNAVGYGSNPIFGGCTGLRSLNLTGTSGYNYSETSGERDYRLTPWYISRDNVLTVTFNPTVSSIGSYAFADCVGIRGDLVLSETLNNIGEYAFKGCTGITSLEIKGNPVLGDAAFDGCTGLRNLILPVSTNAAGNTSRPIFRGCTGLRELKLTGTNGFDYLGSSYQYTPWYYSRANVITLQVEGVEKIGAYMFCGCTGLSGSGGVLSLPGVTSIGEHAFEDCSRISEISGANVVNSDSSAFKGCTALISASLPGLTVIPDSMFENCTALTNATFGNLTEIKESAFAETAKLSTINGSSAISLEHLTRVGNSAFKHSGVINVTLGREGTAIEIGNFVFLECSKLESLKINGNIADFKINTLRLPGSSSFESILKTLVVKHANQFSASLADNFQHLTTVDISGTTNFGSTEGTFRNCRALVTVTLFNDSSSSTHIVLPKSMFEGCISLRNVNLEKAELRNGREFYGCTALDSVDLTSSPAISADAFGRCTGLVHFNAPLASSIGDGAFAGSGLPEVTGSMFPQVHTIGKGVFRGCASLSSAVLSATTEVAGDGSFRDCSALTTFRADGLKGIPADMFRGCSLLTSASADSAIFIRERAFSDCYRLVTIEMNAVVTVGTTSGLTEVNVDPDSTPAVFSGCTALSFVKMTALKGIGPMAFYHCSNLAAFNISGKIDLSDVESVGFAAFAGTGARQVVLGKEGTNSALGEMAFYGCTNLISFSAPSLKILPANTFGNVGKETSVLTTELVTISVPSVTDFSADLHGCTKLKNVVATSAVSFAEGVFYGCTGLQEINIPGARHLGASAFEGCGSLVKVTAPVLSDVGEKAFYDCAVLKNLNSANGVLLTGVSSVGKEAFGNCVAVTAIVLGDNLESLGDGAFKGCTVVVSLSLPISVNSVGSPTAPVFEGCTSISSIAFTGSGEGHDYAENNYLLTPWHISTSSTVTVDFGRVGSIGDYTFKDMSNLKGSISLSVPIGDHAFEGCTGITSLHFGQGAKVGAASFAGCTSLFSLEMPIEMNATVSQSSPAFGGCTSVTSLTFYGTSGYDYSDEGDGDYTFTPWYLSRENSLSISLASTIESIGSNTFRGCYGFSGTLTLPSGVASVGDYAFKDCTGISVLKIQNKAIVLGTEAFGGCTGMGSLTIPVDVNSVGNDARPVFEGCVGITEVHLTGINGVDYLDHQSDENRYFVRTPWHISSVAGNTIAITFDYTVKRIGDHAFRDCGSIAGNVSIPNSVNSIGASAFAGCKDISALVIERNIEIGDAAFAGCSGLKSLSIPMSLNVVGESPESSIFMGCTGILSVRFTGYSSGYNYTESSYMATPWYYSKSNDITITVSDGVTSIGNYTFKDCTGVRNAIVCPSSLTRIGTEAFSGCSNLTSFSGSNVLTVGRATFEGCSNLATVDLRAVTEVTDSLFERCSKLESADLRECTKIGAAAFKNSGIKRINSSENIVDLPKVNSVGEGAFASSAVESVILGSVGTAFTMGEGVFQDCMSLISLRVNGTITELPSSTFMAPGSVSASKLRKLIIPTVTRFTMDMSKGFGDLKEVDISGATIFGAAGQFKGCASLTKVVLYSGSSKAVSLPASMFEGCVSLTTINLERVNFSIQNGREFYGCMALNNIVLTISDVISASSFEGCVSLRSFSAPSVQTVGARAFAGSGMMTITSDTMPLAKSFGGRAFEGCTSLASVAFSANTVSVGEYAFSGCTALASFGAPGLLNISAGSFSGCIMLASINADGVVGIGVLAFSGCTALTSISMAKVSKIGQEVSVAVSVSDESKYAVFRGCTNLGTVTMPELSSVGEFAFYGCDSLVSLNGSEVFDLSEAKYIGRYAFYETGVKNATVGKPEGIKTIGNFAFYGCGSLRSFTSPSLTALPVNLFGDTGHSSPCRVPLLETLDVPAAVSLLVDLHGCTSLTSVVMTSAETFSEGGFRGCTSLVSVVMPKALSIAPYQFYGCTALKDITAPKAASLGEHAFHGCSSLSEVKVPAATEIGEYAFSGCSVFDELNADTGLNPFIRVTSIGAHAFEGTAFSDVVLGPELGFLGESAFEGCNSLTSAVIPDSLSEIGAYAFKNCPLGSVYVAASVRSIGEGAFDYSGTPSMSAAVFWFNGTVSQGMVSAIVKAPGMTVTVHADADSRDAVPSSFVYQEEVSSTISVLLPTMQKSYKAIYGGKIVMPYGSSGSVYSDYYFTMVGGGKTLKVFASESDYSADRTARSGSAVPVYPLSKNVPVTLTGTTSEEGDRNFTVVSGEGTSPLSQTAYYGCVLTVPEFDNDKLVVLSVAIHRIGGDVFYLDPSARHVHAGYIFERFELVSEDMEVTVTFVVGGNSDDVEVYYGSLFGELASFKNPADYNLFKNMEVPAPGYSFVGWFDGNGDKATPGETKFVAGQTYTARFSSLEYKITFSGDHTSGMGPVTVRGPYTFIVDSDPSTGLTLKCKDDSYPQGKDISLKLTGHKVISYFNVTDFSEVSTGQTFTKDIVIQVTFEERLFSVTIRFADSGSLPPGEDFQIDGWTDYGIHKRSGLPEPSNLYRDGDAIVDIPYSKLASGIPIPTPLHDTYSLGTVTVNDKTVTSITYSLYTDSSSEIEITYKMNSGVYWISYNVNDDAGSKVPATTSCTEGGYFTVVPFLGSYTKTGYVFEGYRIDGSDELYKPNYQYMLTSEMIAKAVKCHIVMEGVWKHVEYAVKFDLGAGYVGEPPVDLTGVVVDSDEHGVKIPSVTAPVGNKVGYWYWTEEGTHFSADFRLTKEMIDSYASGTILTLHVRWEAKEYTIGVDTTGMDPAQAKAMKDNYPDRTVVFGQSDATVWDIGDYTLNMHTRFGGWTVGERVIANAAVFTVDAELAIIGDANGDFIPFGMKWDEVSFALSYNLSGGIVVSGSTPNTAYYRYGDLLTLWAPGASQVVKTGYTFGGWSYYDGGAPWTGTTLDDTLAVAGHNNGDKVVMYAVWDKQVYHISYDLNNGTAGSSTPTTVTYATDVFIDIPTRSGYVFSGWSSGDLSPSAVYKGEGGYRGWSGAAVVATVFMNLTDEPGKTVKLTATWSRATYAITVDWNGGEGNYTLIKMFVALGEGISLPGTSDTSRTGYEFGGWVLRSGDTAVLREGATLTQEMAPVSGDKLILYAYWDPVNYTVEYRDRDTQSYRSVSAEYDRAVSLVPGVRSGYEFAGWNITGSGFGSVPLSSTNGTDWNRIGDLSNAYGSYFKNMTVVDGDTVRFDAVWIPLSYTIMYDSNGGPADPPVDGKTYQVGDQITLADYSSLGRFGNKSAVGWSLERGDGNASISLSRFTEGLASNADGSNTITLYAVWKAGQCRVAIDLSGISVSGAPEAWDSKDGVYSVMVDSDTSLKDVLSDWENTVLSKDGYHFEGWSRTGGTVTTDMLIIPNFEKVNQNVIWILAATVVVFIIGAVAVSRFRA